MARRRHRGHNLGATEPMSKGKKVALFGISIVFVGGVGYLLLSKPAASASAGGGIGPALPAGGGGAGFAPPASMASTLAQAFAAVGYTVVASTPYAGTSGAPGAGPFSGWTFKLSNGWVVNVIKFGSPAAASAQSAAEGSVDPIIGGTYIIQGVPQPALAQFSSAVQAAVSAAGPLAGLGGLGSPPSKGGVRSLHNRIHKRF